MPRFSRRALVTAFVTLAVAVAVAGCGGSSSKSITTATVAGGGGQTIDGIPCETSEQLTYHVHAHLALLLNGKSEAVPALIGIPGASTGAASCLYFLHTHDATGVIHIEAPAKRAFTLGQFFDIWGQPLSATQATNLHGKLRFYTGKKLYTGNPREIKLAPHELITIEQGKAVTPPSYTFAPGL